MGGIDVLVNNAGINGPEKSIVDISSREWDEVLDTNLKGTFFCSREATRRMLMHQEPNSRLRDYSIINISSVHYIQLRCGGFWCNHMQALKRGNGDAYQDNGT